MRNEELFSEPAAIRCNELRDDEEGSVVTRIFPDGHIEYQAATYWYEIRNKEMSDYRKRGIGKRWTSF